MAASLGSIFAELGLKTTIGADIAKARGEMMSGLSGMATGSAGVLGAVATSVAYVGAAVGAAAGIVGGVAVNSFKTFEQSVTNAASVLGLSGSAFQAARANIAAVSQELGQRTTYSSKQAADAMYNLASAGYDVSKMTANDLAPMLNLAAGTQYDLAGTTATTAATLAQFGLGFESSGRLSDVFALAIGQSQASMDKLAVSMNYAGPAMDGVNGTLEQTTALLSVLYNRGLNAEMAGTGVRTSIAALLAPTDRANSAFTAMGLTADQVNPELNSMTNIFSLLGARGMTMGQAIQIFGREGANAALILAQNSGELQTLTTELENAGGAAEKMAAQQLDTLGGSLDNLQGSIENILINIGGDLAPAIRGIATTIAAEAPNIQAEALGIIDFFRQLGSELGPAFESLRQAGANVTKILSDLFKDLGIDKASVINAIATSLNTLAGAIETVTGFAAAHPTLTKYALAISAVLVALAVLPSIVAALTAAGAAVGAFGSAVAAGAALITTPIGLIIAALVLLKVAWDNNWGDIQGKFETAKGLIATSIKTLDQTLSESYHGMIMAAGQLQTNLGTIWDLIKASFQALYDGGVAIFRGLYSALQTVWASIVSAANVLYADLQTVWTSIHTAIQTTGAAIVTTLQDWYATLQTIYAQVQAGILALYTFLLTQWDTIRAAIQTAAAAIVTTLQGWYNTLQTIYAQVRAGLLALYNDILARWNAIQATIRAAAAAIVTTLQGWYNTLQTIYAQVKAALLALYNDMLARWNEIQTMIRTAAAAVITILQGWYANLQNVFNQVVAAARALYNEWQARWNEIINTIRTAAATILQYLSNLVTEAGNRVRDMRTAILNGIAGIADSIRGYATAFYNAGAAILQSLYRAVSAEFDKVIGLAEEKLGELKELMPNSPAKAGPFRILPFWGDVIPGPILDALDQLDSVKTTLASKFRSLWGTMTSTSKIPLVNLTGNIEGVKAALHKVLDSPKAEGSSSTSSSSSTGGVWSRTSSTDTPSPETAAGITQAQAQELISKMDKLIQAQAPQIIIRDVKLDKEYNFDKLITDIEQYQTAKRRQRGAY